MSYAPWFPEPGSYIKYFDEKSKEYKFRRLLWRRDPVRYPRRMPSVAASSVTAVTKGDEIIFKDINPSETKRHIYLAYLGLCPGFLFNLYHPYNDLVNKWDERLVDISEDFGATLTYEDSPYEFPTKRIGIEHDRYPGLKALNILGRAAAPEIIWIASLYVVKEHAELSPDEVSKLQAGVLRSYPWDFGGVL